MTVSWPYEPRGIHPATVWEHSPCWAPWEAPSNPRVSVGSVVDARGVVAATTSARLGPALARALLDANIRSHQDPAPGSLTCTNEEVGPALVEQPGPVDDDLHGGVADG